MGANQVPPDRDSSETMPVVHAEMPPVERLQPFDHLVDRDGAAVEQKSAWTTANLRGESVPGGNCGIIMNWLSTACPTITLTAASDG